MATVKSHAAKAIARLRLDPELVGGSLEPDSEPPAGVARLAAVQSRIQQARHYRVATVGSACAVILALLLGYAINPVHRTNPHPAASPSSPLINGFPEYQLGTRLVATATATAAQPKVAMAWIASTPDLTFFLRCGASTLVTASVVVSTGNGELGEMACEARPDTPATGGGSGATWPVERMVKAGVTKGAQVEMSVSVAVERGISTPSDLSVAVAVGERVSWPEYPFPAKPATLAPLDSNQLDQRPGVITLRPPDSEPQVSASATWGSATKCISASARRASYGWRSRASR